MFVQQVGLLLAIFVGSSAVLGLCAMKNIEDVYPLSAMQEGMLFDALYEPGSGAYVMQVSSAIEGDLNVLAFQRSWQAIVDHHPCLRSALLWERVDKPLQIVRKYVRPSWDQPDWRTFGAQEQETRLRDYIWRERERGFDFAQAPLMRMALIRLNKSRWQFLWTCSHLVMDGWSSNIVFGELFNFYQSYSEELEPSWAPSGSYRDLIRWMRQQNRDGAEAFWQNNLRGFAVPTMLDSDKPVGHQNSKQAPAYGQITAIVCGDTLATLQAIVRRHRLTLNTLVQGAWAWLLGCYSGSSEVVFGVTFTVRPASLAGAEAIVGPMVNTLPMRVSIARQQCLLDWLKTLQDQQIEVRKYDFCSLVDVKEWSEVPHSSPLFESIFVFQNYPMAGGALKLSDNLHFLSTEVITSTAYPLTLVVEPAEQMTLRILFDQGRFTISSINGFLSHLTALLNTMADNPEQQVGELSLLTFSERQQLLIEWSDTTVNYEGRACLHELFEEQVRLTPEAVAVGYEQQQLTYEELDRRANRLANYLRYLEVGPDVLVGVCLERSLEMVVALIGVLKAGGAYVPLDPSYPPDRIAFVVADAQVQVLLTQRALSQSWPAGTAQQLCIDEQWCDIARQPADSPRAQVASQNLAYVIYTSGSTGKPKGAMNQHGAIRNRLLWMQEQYGLTSDDAILQKTPFSFDVSVWEFFWPLITGARLIMAKPGAQGDGEYLAHVIAEQRITTIHFVPSMLAAFVVGEHQDECSSLRRVVCSGEALPAELASAFFARFNADLHNLYGPTEAAVDVTYWHCERKTKDSSVPIGRPIGNIQMYVLNDDLLPIPVRIPGEIYIAGEGLGRGYWHKPDLTAERFLPNPHALQPGSRVYRSGDQGRYRTDGAIEFMGRLDYQVKIRGFRVELGEIEAALLSHPSVERAVVLALEDGNGGKRLVAYVVAQADIMTADLQDFLKKSLPDYMVPTVFVKLDEIPLTSSGKIDRRALFQPPEIGTKTETPYLAPQTQVEQQLAQIWAEVLKRDQIGANDNFFSLGGHSLLATRVVSRVKGAFNTTLSLRQLFEAPTVAGLSQLIEQQLQESTDHDSQPHAVGAIARVARVRRPPSQPRAS